MTNLIYLVLPYRHHSTAVRINRADKARMAFAALIRAGCHVFSPIEHSWQVAEENHFDSHEYWMAIDLAIMPVCSELVVLMLDGWKESRGVKEEILNAGLLGLPIRYCKVDQDGELSWYRADEI